MVLTSLLHSIALTWPEAPETSAIVSQAAPGCTSNVTDAQNRCCASGLPDRAGVCCPAGSSLDALGSCCAPGSALDAAGTCGGAARLLDVLGAGCRSGFVDARGACCEVRRNLLSAPLIAVRGAPAGPHMSACKMPCTQDSEHG